MTTSASEQPVTASPVESDHDLAHRHARYWRRTLRVTVWLLGGWLAVTLLAGLWLPGRDWSLFGWPVGYWAASQGALVLYCALVWAYSFIMDRIDAQAEDRRLD